MGMDALYTITPVRKVPSHVYVVKDFEDCLVKQVVTDKNLMTIDWDKKVVIFKYEL